VVIPCFRRGVRDSGAIYSVWWLVGVHAIPEATLQEFLRVPSGLE